MRWQRWDASEDPAIMKVLGEAIERAEAHGIDEDEAIEKFLEAYEENIGSVFGSLGDSMAGALKRDGHEDAR